jgi:hypothetical protein
VPDTNPPLGGAVVEPVRNGTIEEGPTGGVVVEYQRNGTIDEQTKSGILDESATGGEGMSTVPGLTVSMSYGDGRYGFAVYG